jgi:signal transduction histidine kinase
MQDLVNYEYLRELQHFAKLGRMSASLLHEISNPLTAAMLNLELSDKQSAGVRRARRDMKLMRRYVEAARQQVKLQGKAASFRIQPQLDQLKCVIIPLARKSAVRVNIGTAPDCQLYGDPVKFQHILSNLIVNAIEAYGEIDDIYKPFRIIQVTLSRDNGCLVIDVNDWGKGISAEALPRLFDTFYTTKGQSGNGLGIGLAIVKQYVEDDFHGSITVSSSRPLGTQFIVKLPVRIPG